MRAILSICTQLAGTSQDSLGAGETLVRDARQLDLLYKCRDLHESSHSLPESDVGTIYRFPGFGMNPCTCAPTSLCNFLSLLSLDSPEILPGVHSFPRPPSAAPDVSLNCGHELYDGPPSVGIVHPQTSCLIVHVLQNYLSTRLIFSE